MLAGELEAVMRWIAVATLVLAGCLSAREGTSAGGVGQDAVADTAVAGGDGAGAVDTSSPLPFDATGSNDATGGLDIAVLADGAVADSAVQDTSPGGVVDTAVAGDSHAPGCPHAVITVAEGEEAIPQTLLHLDGAGSFGDAPIIGYEWTVEQPAGSVSTFWPNAAAAAPSFEVNVVGTYLIHLAVRDAEGRGSCQPATYLVTVAPEQAIHVELVWTTPGDPDETDTGFTGHGDSVGSDLDLHLLHPNAVAVDGGPGWFDPEWDCYWSNISPDSWANGAASLDRDDTDGGGPENLNVSSPQAGVTYRIGVHYWDDWAFGYAFATVRVYVYAALVYESPATKLESYDLWDVGTLTWPAPIVVPSGRCDSASGSVCAADAQCDGACRLAITPNYPVPFL